MFESRAFTFAVGLVCLVYFARPALAFGAGNIASISKIEGQNWRHGDIADALLQITMAKAFGGKKFSKHNVSRVYFGNWLRDYSQGIDVGTVKHVSADAIRLLLSVLGFMTFGFGSREFEITAERIGCYRPEEHIDNPKNYADNVDAREYHRELRGPVDESVELAIDPETGMKNYIANENVGITTSAGLTRDLLTRCIELGRSFARTGDKAERNESFRLMGTALHCLEDYFAHSNYCELALIEMGETDVFPHCGRNTQIRLPGVRRAVYPIITGTFGGVDFIHSVTGEVSDKLTQNEIEQLQGTLENSGKADTSKLRNLLDMIPDGVFGGEKQSDKVDQIQSNAASAQLENMSVSPKEPEEYTKYCQNIFRQIMPIIEWHDSVMKSISNATSKIPVLPKIMGQVEEQLSVFVFGLLAPFILPVLNQIGAELKVGSEEIIASSEREQHIVFHDDDATDPTHSMISKDHFSNILNEIGGRCAAYTVRWVVPQIMDAIDDENVDINRTCDRIISGILHHPALRDAGRDGANEGRHLLFNTVQEWWDEGGESRKEQYRQQLSRRGIQNGDNHREGEHDTGHGCAGKLKMRKQFGEPETWEDKVAGHAAQTISGAITGIIGSSGEQLSSRKSEGGIGGLLGGIASSLLGKGDSESKREDSGYSESQATERYDGDGGYSQTQSSYRQDDAGNYAKTQSTSQYSQGTYSQSTTSKQYSSGGGYSESQSAYQSQSQSGGDSYGGRSDYNQRTEQKSYSGGYQQSGSTGGSQYQGSQQQSGYGSASQYHGSQAQSGYGGSSQGQSGYGGQSQSGYGGSSQGQSGYGGQSQGGYGGQGQSGYGRQSQGGHGGQSQSGYGGQSQGGYGGQGQSGYGRQSQGGHGGQSQSGYGEQSQGRYGGQSQGGHGGQGQGRYGGQGQSGYGGQGQGGYDQQRRY